MSIENISTVYLYFPEFFVCLFYILTYCKFNGKRKLCARQMLLKNWINWVFVVAFTFCPCHISTWLSLCRLETPKRVLWQTQGSHRNSKTQFHDFSMIFHDQQCNFNDYLMNDLQPPLLAASSPCRANIRNAATTACLQTMHAF